LEREHAPERLVNNNRRGRLSQRSSGRDRTVDETAHNWIDVTYLEQAEFDSLVAARKAKAVKKPIP